MSKKRLTFKINELVNIYYERMFDDLKVEINESMRVSGEFSVITNAHIMRQLISNYFLAKYGKDEKRKVRNIFFKDIIDDIEGDQANLVRRHEA